MQALFLIGLQNSVAVLFLAVVVWGVTRIWRSAPLAHLLWLLLVLKLLTPPLVAVDLVGLTFGRAPAAVPIRLPQPSNASFYHVEPAASNSADAELETANRSVPKMVDPPEAIAIYERSLFRAQVAAASDQLWQMCLPYLVNLWLAGVIVCGLVALRRIVRFQRLVNGMLPAATALQDLTHQLCGRLGIIHQPDVRISDRVAAPLFWSLNRQQTIVLPGALVQQLEPQKLELVLAHELTHLRRRDHWVRWLELIVTVLYWWNPVLWWIRRQLHQAEEQCCDAWVNWLFPDRVKGYAEALLYAAESKSPPPSKIPSLASPFFRCSSGALKRRIRLILRGDSPRTLARPGWTCLVVLAVLILPFGLNWSLSYANSGWASTPFGGEGRVKSIPPAATCQVVGTVKVQGTNEPVVNATVRVSIADQRRFYEGQTDAAGRYTVAVPPGDARTFGFRLPAGYWDDHLTSFEEFATSSAHPVFTKNFSVQREPVWQVRLKLPAPSSRALQVFVGGYQQLKGRILSVENCTIDQNSIGQITIPDTGGPFQFSAGTQDSSLQSVGAVTLRFDKGFRPAAVAGVRQSAPLSFEITDDQGRHAWLNGAEASIVARQVLIAIPARVRPARSFGKITGLIVDQDGRPLASAHVGIALSEESGGGSFLDDWGPFGESDSAGRFILPRVPLPFSDDPHRYQTALVVTREGYGGISTPPRFDVSFNSEGIQDVGEVRLRPGYDIRLQVVDRTGKPIADASVRPSGFANSKATTRTDQDGYCWLRDMDRGYGTLSVLVSYGKHAISQEVVVENRTYILRLP